MTIGTRLDALIGDTLVAVGRLAAHVTDRALSTAVPSGAARLAELEAGIEVFEGPEHYGPLGEYPDIEPLSSAPARPRGLVVAGSPEPTPCAAATGAGSGPRLSENPIYAQMQLVADAAAVVAEVLDQHKGWPKVGDGDAWWCLTDGHICSVHRTFAAWTRHVAPLIVAALQQ